jgi:putative endopeptidase
MSFSTLSPSRRRLMFRSCMILLGALTLATLGTVSGPGLPAGQAAADLKTSEAKFHGVDPAILDKTCKPCDDFYEYANGLWLKQNPVPPAFARWGRFDELAERNRDDLRQILEKAAANTSAAAGSNERKIGDFYASCMDEKEINAAGTAPLMPELGRIDAIHNTADLQAEIARLHSMGIRAAFNFGSTQDEKKSTEVIGSADQGGLGLPDRDYYTKTDDKSKTIREQYAGHISKMFVLLGDKPDEAAAEAQTVLKLETKLAENSLTRVERRDPEKTYHRMNGMELKTLTPNWSWDTYFHEIGYTDIPAVDVSAPKFFEAFSTELKTTGLADWKVYLRWHLVNSAAPWLSQPFVDEDFSFKGKTLQGTQELLPRWKRCVAATDRQLGEALGQIYTQQYFPPAAKASAQKMVNNLIAALRDDLQTLPWMSPATRQQAVTKLASFTTKIGYPDKWRDYSAYAVVRESYALNQMRGDQFRFHRELDKIGKPVDHTEWDMTPPTVNAYYDPQKNEIVFPAGILQPPFFDPKADDASNYGGMGAVIGHEMTHGFDDEGRKYDGQGNLRDWWTPEDMKNFDERADCVEKQFDAYKVQGDLHENGKLVLGESIADLGGITIAYRALQKEIAGKPQSPIDGFTPNQRFFLAFAQIWSENDRPEYERLMLNTNEHPLDHLRAVAPPSNMQPFFQAFGCKDGDAMVRPSDMRCQIW